MSKENAEFDKLAASLDSKELAYFDEVATNVARAKALLTREYPGLPGVELADLKAKVQEYLDSTEEVLRCYDAKDRVERYGLFGKAAHKALDVVDFLSFGLLGKFADGPFSKWYDNSKYFKELN